MYLFINLMEKYTCLEILIQATETLQTTKFNQNKKRII